MSRLSDVFAAARREQRTALVGYLPVGYPDPETYRELVAAAFAEGLDVLECGIPAEDPVLDGPVIQAANRQVRETGLDTDGALELGGQALHAAGGCGVVMIYRRELYAYGVANLIARSAALGYAGILPVAAAPHETAEIVAAGREGRLDVVGFLHAATELAEIPAAMEGNRGFIYVQGMTGATGQHLQIDAALEERLRRVTEIARGIRLPAAVGFGIRESEDVQAMQQIGVDGVIIGTAFVQAASRGLDAFRAYVRDLAAAARVEERG